MNNKLSCIVTITDGISPTSMPFNEFVLFRLKHYPHEKQVLLQVFERGTNGDVVIPNDVEYYSLGISLRNLRHRIRVLEDDYDVIAYHIHEGKSVLLFSIATFLRYRKKTIYTLHSTYRNYPLHNKFFSFLASLLVRDIVCVSKTSLKYFPKVLKHLRGNHAMYIQNGVDIERIASVRSLETENKRPFTLIYVARLVPLKRHSLLFDVLRFLPEVHLQLVGIGPLEDTLRKEAREKGIESQVFFYGLKSREEVYRMLKAADLFVSSSYYEGLPIGLLEAMGCGIPCLVSDIEQHDEIAEKCPSLQLCSDSINQWVRKIRDYQLLSKEELDSLREQNTQSIIKHFSLSSMHENYNKLYYGNE